MAKPLRDASTVLPLRNARGDLEVFMVKRASSLGFLGGHHVFPGGAVDAQDADPRFDALLDGIDAEREARRFGMDDSLRARAHVVAALRELFEESGILLARDGDGEDLLGGADSEVVQRFQLARGQVASGALAFAELLEKESLRLAADSLCYFAHWITPKSGEKRFDTRFFIARMPDGQAAEHDPAETIEGEWVRPRDALERYGLRTIQLVAPTI